MLWRTDEGVCPYVKASIWKERTPKLAPVRQHPLLRRGLGRLYNILNSLFMRLFYLIILGLFTLQSQAQTNIADYLTLPQPKRETRAVWLTTLSNLDWPKTYATSKENIEKQKQELRDILDSYQKAHINTVLLQARVRAATIYPSEIEPWDHCITGVEGRAPGFGYDPLAFAIDECHRRGMEIHAWIATIPVGMKNTLGCRTIVKRGFRVRNYSTGSYLDPADPAVPRYLARICGEITRKYDIDGINLDYIRYPDGWPLPSYRNGDTPEARRAHITAIVRAIHDEVKAIKPWVKMSCSPIGKYSDLSRYSSKNFNARDRVAQEAQEWLREGLMDQLYPMQYFRGENYFPFIADWVENRYSRDVVTGLGTYFLDPRQGNWRLSDMTRQMYVSRSLGMGHAHFRSYFLTSNQQGIYDFECRFNSSLALPPVTKGGRAVSAPTTEAMSPLVEYGSEHGITMRWKGNAPYYNIYASRSYPVDISNARNLLYTRFRGNQLHFSNVDEGLYFAVTAMDRYGNESPALQELSSQPSQHKAPLLATDGQSVTLPPMVKQADIVQYELRSMQGVTLLRLPNPTNRHSSLNISSLSPGMYQLFGITKKRREYCIGSLAKKDK